ncbi:metallo-beta-lactamase superfamily protein [Tamaricihabitans halophyticus]|uniref:Metallo-beta-lactamase superfamily protein n=1 Tax=Tamaricihabitans halophyticus TaxID=1262583 RepID=A0A4R2R569_9PSEU|nr:MBL fold metallo-hydrolase [Tamaricihabitans halophyticus]TCP57177.1 metallo-beta-lactamase superfamily protein [Tamaricihabitans halophyticus]
MSGQSKDTPVWICPTCGNHYAAAETPPSSCVLCTDERQWVPPTGQRWTTMAELAEAGYRTEVRQVEPGLFGIGLTEPLGVGQRGMLVCTPQGNVLWDPPGYLDDKVLEELRALGGVHTVSASHPHMYGAIVDYSHAFDAPILLPEADAHWLNRPDPSVRTWSGVAEVVPGVTLVQCGGHFPGSAALHWADGADGQGVLLVGDTLLVTPGEDRVTFMWSAPNRLPLPEREVRQVVRALRPYRFDRIYAGWWDPVLRSGANHVVERSAERYIQFLRGDVALG